jgi:iron complex transport system substrate-binding protein
MQVIRFLLLSYLFCLGAVSQAVPLQTAAKSSPKAQRLISLAPSNTELIYSLKSGDKLIAVSESCDFPAEAKGKEKVGNFSSVKMEKIAKLKPDLIVLVSGQEKLDNDLKKHHFSTVVLDNSSITKIGKNLRQLGDICKQEAEAKRLSAAFENSIQELKALTEADKSKPKVFICVWPQPLMSAGKSSFMNEGITIAGGTNCTGDLPQPYPRINQERLLLMQPDIILIPHELGSDKFWTKSPWTSLKAVKEKHVYVLPQHETDCLARPTLRYLDALYWLAMRLHPGIKSSIDNWKTESAKAMADKAL